MKQMRARKNLAAALIIFAVFAMVFVTAAPAYAGDKLPLGEPTTGNTFLDALIYRPVGLISIPLGCVLFVFSLPFSATGRNVGQAFHNLVVVPIDWTFNRPLGDI
ncbi:MAG: hypothetical protein GXP53_02760 [Deltaproteobacteria bacterium]|nr:hypothetical protein [Deltaproteobacteria bacterium]